ncbi:hypothetical protein OSB71_16845 [Streptomyces sp. JHD 1]|nr:hypothetical protein [Streptomyces sp. JHD 1]
MGWTYDQRDVSRTARGRGPGARPRLPRAPRPAAQDAGDPRIGIPSILGRRARWVSARLRHR